MTSIAIRSAAGSYPVTIRAGALARLGEVVRSAGPAATTLLAADARLVATHGLEAEQSLRAAGCQVTVAAMKASEAHKSLATVRKLYDAMLDARLERRSAVVALGGGVIGDAAGFAAATFLRGLPLVLVPTTLLAMVDASIGGKTAVNLSLPRGELGKNLVGAIWPPRAVVTDPLLLRTLPPRERRCGLAECVKHGIIGDQSLLLFLEHHVARIHALDLDVVTELIERCVRIKAAIVEQDEHDIGRRAQLNLGHTFAHVIEPMPTQRLKHGEAVAIGLCAAMHAAVQLGRVDQASVDHLARLLRRLGLPTKLRNPAAINTLIEPMALDKKVEDGRLRLVLPRRGGGAEIVADAPREVIEAAWRSVQP